MTDALVGVMLSGRYRLDGVLGVGGSAIVYRAWDEQLHRAVAVKVLNHDSDDPARAERHQLELRTLARLTHPGLVTVYAGQVAGEEQTGQPGFIVLELIEGGSLAASLRAGPWTVPRVLRLGELLADALAYIHARGIVHRDVKPGNVLLGPGDEPKLTDFGILRSERCEAVTQPGTAIGTAAYLSPEQVLGREADGAADVYSLGLVLLEALTGQRNYDGAPLEAALARLARQPSVPAWLPTPVARLLTAMTAREPGDRPTAAAVRTRLRLIGDTAAVPVAAAPGPVADGAGAVRAGAPAAAATVLLRRPAKTRRPRQVGAGVLAFCLAGLALEIARGGAVAADPPAATPPTRPVATASAGAHPSLQPAAAAAGVSPAAAPLTATVAPPAPAATSTVTAAQLPATPAGTPSVPASAVAAATVPAVPAVPAAPAALPAAPRAPRNVTTKPKHAPRDKTARKVQRKRRSG